MVNCYQRLFGLTLTGHADWLSSVIYDMNYDNYDVSSLSSLSLFNPDTINCYR